VAQPGQDRRLVHELLHAAAAVAVQPLHGNRSAVAKEPLVHGAEAAFADLSLVAEAVRRVLQLLVRELVRLKVVDAAGLHVAAPIGPRRAAGGGVLQEPRGRGHLVLSSLADVQERHDHLEHEQNTGSYGGS
jgi:hypothetical protein